MERNRPARIPFDYRFLVETKRILKRLNSFALADPDNPAPGDIRMTRTQVMTALALLRKVMPDLASVEVSGNPDRPLTVQVIRFSDPDPGLIIDASPTRGENPHAGALDSPVHGENHNHSAIDSQWARENPVNRAISQDDSPAHRENHRSGAPSNGGESRSTPDTHGTAGAMRNGTLIERLTAVDPALSADIMSSADMENAATSES